MTKAWFAYILMIQQAAVAVAHSPMHAIAIAMPVLVVRKVRSTATGAASRPPVARTWLQ